MKPEMKRKLDEVNDQIENLRGDVQKKWLAFEKARDEFAAAGGDANNTDSDAFKSAEQVHKDYADACDRVQDLERVRDGLFKMAAVGADRPSPEAGSMAAKADAVASAKTQQAQDHAIKDLASAMADRIVNGQELKDIQHVLQSSSAAIGVKSLGKGLDREEAKALITGLSDSSAGAFITNQRVGFVRAGYREARLLDLLTVGTTDADAVEYAREDTPVLNAAETPEATSSATIGDGTGGTATTVTGGVKPEAAITYTKVTETVKTIANWVPATRRSLEDVGQLRTLIEARLRYALQFRLETQTVQGNGTGENFRGILNTPGILTQARGADTQVDAIHRAITQIRLGYFEPNGVALHPNDWQTIRLAKDTQGDYYYGPPALAGTQALWGLQAVASTAAPAGTAIVGDWGQAALFMRSGIQVLASDSHADFFVRNLVAILAEMRAAFGVLVPAAFASVTGL